MRAKMLALLAILLFSVNSASAEAVKFGHGINLYPWFQEPRKAPEPNPEYLWPPFKGNDWAKISAQDLDDIVAFGFDFVRLPFDPGPFMYFDDKKRAELIHDLEMAVDLIISKGLKVELVPLSPPKHQSDNTIALVNNLNGIFDRYLILMQDLTSMLVKKDLGKVAIETMNEPKVPCTWPLSLQWNAKQMRIYSAIRSISPDLTIVLTGACSANPDALKNISTVEDKNVLYTFHYYDPYFFTHQGFGWSTMSAVRFLWLAYPAIPSEKLNSLKKTEANLHIYTYQYTGDLETDWKQAKDVIDKYYNRGFDRDMMSATFAEIAEWARRNKIPNNHIFLGEFGVWRPSTKLSGAAAPDRLRWLRDVREQAEKYEFSWCLYNYFSDFGLTYDYTPGNIDMGMVKALNLHEFSTKPRPPLK